MLQAKLTTTETDKLVQHQLDLIAPGLNFYRERLLSATHGREMLYPVTVNAEAFASKPAHPMSTLELARLRLDPSLTYRKAATDEEFVRLVREVLQSADVRGLIYSLIARINGQNPDQQKNGVLEAEGGTSSGEKAAG
jgi:hypothetical protein